MPERMKPARRAEMAPQLDLLNEPVIGIARADGTRDTTSLPGVLDALGRDDVRAFSALQAHQQHAWHAFLVQLAAIALHAAGEQEPRQSAAAWRDLLLRLTKRPGPWRLVIDDPDEPAFMQPPVPEGKLDKFGTVEQPDVLDVLMTAKNHDVKGARIDHPRPEHWLYALVSLQTMQGYSGLKNYGIARMNGGYGSRPGVGLAPRLDLGARFQRDVAVLLVARASIVKRYMYAARGGLGLLWLEAWNGKRSLSVDGLDPYFIEICRRVRLQVTGERLVARVCPTDIARVAADALNGATGDPWTPVTRGQAKAFSATEAGFGYRVARDLLLGDWEPGAAQALQRGEKEMLFVASVLARGQGKTSGYHERVIPLPAKVMSWLTKDESRNTLNHMARGRIDVVAKVQLAVLKPALLNLLQGAPEKLNRQDDRAQRWLDRHDHAVDAIFFERLWADLDRDMEEADRGWTTHVIDLAREQLRDALASAPVPDARRYRAFAAAERVFEGAARNRFPDAFEERKAAHDR